MTNSITPGTYLRLRREAAALGLPQAAAAVAMLPWAIRRANDHDVRRMHARLLAAEEDCEPFTQREIDLVRSVIALDPQIYLQLVDIHLSDRPGRFAEPQLCRLCACSWCDPCVNKLGQGCAWADRDLCTACAEPAAPKPPVLMTLDQFERQTEGVPC